MPRSFHFKEPHTMFMRIVTHPSVKKDNPPLKTTFFLFTPQANFAEEKVTS